MHLLPGHLEEPVTTKRIKLRRFDAGREFPATFFESVSEGLPGPARNKAQRPGMHHARIWCTLAVSMPDPGGPVWDQKCSSTPKAFTPVSLLPLLSAGVASS